MLVNDVNCFAGQWAATFFVLEVIVSDEEAFFRDPRFSWWPPRAREKSPCWAVRRVDFRLDVVLARVLGGATAATFESVQKCNIFGIVLVFYY
jgi:hypothetical protein